VPVPALALVQPTALPLISVRPSGEIFRNLQNLSGRFVCRFSDQSVSGSAEQSGHLRYPAGP